MEPLSLAIAAVVVGLCVVVGLSILWWAIKTAVRTAVKVVVLSVAAVAILCAISTVTALVVMM